MLTKIFRIDQFNLKAIICRASMYVTLHQSLMPDAERLFAKAIELSTPNVDPILYQGLGFACLKQKKIEEAILHFEKYLQLSPSDQKVAYVLSEIKSGNQGETYFYPLKALVPPQTEVTSKPSWTVNESAVKQDTPWWQFW